MVERLMKDSGIEWIGSIPDSWRLERLSWHLSEINEKNDPIKTTNILSLTNKAGVLPYEDRGNQGNKAKENYNEYKIAYPDTIVANSMNILIGSVGLCNYFGCVSPVYYVLKANDNSNLRFMNYIMQTTEFQKELRRYANGIMEIRLRVSSEDIFKRLVPIPSYEEQARIADFLDKKVSEIDTVISKTKESIEEYKKLKQSIITEVVTKGLDPNAEMKDSGIEWIKRIPKQWEIKKLKMLFSFGKGLPITKENLTENGIKVISYGQIHAKWNTGVSLDERIFRFVPAQYSIDFPSTKVCKGDFIFADTSEDLEGCGNNIYIDKNEDIYAGYHAITMHSLYGDNNKYLAYLFKNNDWRIQVRAGSEGVKLCSISKKNLKNATVILPDKNEQVKIVEYLDAQCSKYDSLISKKEQVIIELEQYKKSLIYEYVTGKKEVSA